MRVVMSGTGGAAGWPAPGCQCASCAGATAHGLARKPSVVVVDGTVRLALDSAEALGHVNHPETAASPDTPIGASPVESILAGGHDLRVIPGGWEVTGPDGERLLCSGGTDAIPEPPADASPYDYAVLDMLADPAQLGLLRRRGLVVDSTRVGLACADHRATSERELIEHCGLWGAEVMGDGEEMHDRRYGQPIRRVLVIGGARSGKSERAELRVLAEPDVTYVAAGGPAPGGPAAGARAAGGPAAGARAAGGPAAGAGEADAGDEEWSARVAAHRARRPAWWRTVETTDLAEVLGDSAGTLLIDGLGTWLAAVMDECGVWASSQGSEQRLARRIDDLVRAWRDTRNHVVAVSDETGWGVVPETYAGRLFRDQLGRLNQLLTRESEATEFVIAGRVIPLPLW